MSYLGWLVWGAANVYLGLSMGYVIRRLSYAEGFADGKRFVALKALAGDGVEMRLKIKSSMDFCPACSSGHLAARPERCGGCTTVSEEEHVHVICKACGLEHVVKPT